MRPQTAFDASSDEPGGSVTLTWMLPSSNGGRKSRPSRESCQPAMATPSQVSTSNRPGMAILRRMSGVARALRPESTRPSCLRWVARDWGSR